MRVLAGGLIGAISGWFLGYFIVLSRFSEEHGALAATVGMMGAPFGGDTREPAGPGREAA